MEVVVVVVDLKGIIVNATNMCILNNFEIVKHWYPALVMLSLYDCFFLNVGNPFVFYVSDLSKLSVHGDGLETVQCNKKNSFTITGPGLQQNDLDVQIKGKFLQMILLMKRVFSD